MGWSGDSAGGRPGKSGSPGKKYRPRKKEEYED